MRFSMVVVAVVLAALTFPTTLGVGAKVPSLTLPRDQGPPLVLGDFCKRYDATVLYFWSFERGANPEDFATLQNLHTSEFSGVAVVGVCVNGTDTAANDWRRQVGCTFELVVDASAQGTVARMFGVKRFPTMFVIDRKGQIAARLDGMDPAKLNQTLLDMGCKPSDSGK